MNPGWHRRTTSGFHYGREHRRGQLLKQYSVASVDALPIAFSGVSLQEGEEHTNEVFDKHFGALFDQYARQNRADQWSALAAPSLAVPAALASSEATRTACTSSMREGTGKTEVATRLKTDGSMTTSTSHALASTVALAAERSPIDATSIDNANQNPP